MPCNIEEVGLDQMLIFRVIWKYKKPTTKNGGWKMANISGVQEDVKFCPKCKGNLRNIPRSEMKSKEYSWVRYYSG